MNKVILIGLATLMLTGLTGCQEKNDRTMESVQGFPVNAKNME